MIKFFLGSIKKIGSGLFYSFDNKCDTGFDPRKLTAWTIVAMAGYAHLKYVDKDNIVEVLMVDFTFIALLLGIVTMEQVIKFRATKTEEKPKE
jgi:ATP:corrinoid adenosyltransferase